MTPYPIAGYAGPGSPNPPNLAVGDTGELTFLPCV